ncbi:MAG: sugar ABC transporter permease [Clostridia bacterium]|nr:sugar ABC transporter permease [Clostridia bacterium]
MQKTNLKKSGIKREQTFFLVAILAIPTISWLIFWLYVNFSAFTMAFQNQEGKWDLINFELFWQSFNSPYGTNIGLALKNTLKYWMVGAFINFPVAVIIAYFLFKKIRFHKFFRIMFFMPVLLTGVVLVCVYNLVIRPYGVLDSILNLFGKSVPSSGYLNDPATATNAILIYSIWTGAGTTIVLVGSAMARVPVSVLEAAELDGCSPTRELFQIILPLIWPTLSTMVLLTFTNLLTSSGPILLFAPSGEYETATLSFWIYKQVYGVGAFGTMGGTQNYGLVSATGLIFTVVWVPVILFIRWLTEKIPVVEY